MTKDLKKRTEELLREVGEQYEIEIETTGIEVDHVHIVVSAPPKYSAANRVEVSRSVVSKVVFQEFLWFKKHLWAAGFWQGRDVGSKAL